MAKPFSTYQYLEGQTMTERDKQEINSKFWGGGKWNNFVLPFLPEDCHDLSLVDMGCNAGLFLKFASDKGFKEIIGVDSSKDAIELGSRWRDERGYKYKMFNLEFVKREENIMEFGSEWATEKCVSALPIVDYTILANSHYYMTVNDFIDYLDVLQYKTRYCIIVTDKKRHLNRCWASADIEDIRSYFSNWEEVGYQDELPFDNEIHPRHLKSICFKSKFIERVPVADLDSSNHVQDQFYAELDQGIDYKQTRYYKIIKHYRKKWEPEKLDKWFNERMAVYKDLKENGLKKPILIDKNNKILDGNHRYSMMRHLGNETILVRKV